MIGTGFGGARRRAGDVVRELIPMLRRRAEALDVDLALVTNDPLTFAAPRSAAWRPIAGLLRRLGWSERG